MIDIKTITAQDFRDKFPRGFAPLSYLPIWEATTVYNDGDVVYYQGSFFKCDTNGTVGTEPSGTSPWLNYSDQKTNYVLDEDIEEAFIEAQMNFNPSIFGKDEFIKTAYLYLTAHFLIHDISASNDAFSQGGGGFINSRSAGSVSESYSIPDSWLRNPYYGMLVTTAYGRKYLHFLRMATIGNVITVKGDTRP